MADKAEKDGAQDTPVEKELPTPVYTETSEAKRSEPDPLATVKELLEQNRRDIQSMMDKRFANEEKKLAGSLSVLEDFKQLKAAGLSDEAAEMELRLRAIEQGRLPAEAAPGRAVAGGGQADSQFDLAGFLANKGLDANDDAVLKVIMTPHKGPLELQKDLLDLKVAQLTASPSASAAPAMGEGKRLPDTPETDEEKKRRILQAGPNNLDLKLIREKGGGVILR